MWRKPMCVTPVTALIVAICLLAIGGLSERVPAAMSRATSQAVPGTADGLGNDYELAAGRDGMLAVAFQAPTRADGVGPVRIAIRRVSGHWDVPRSVSGLTFGAQDPHVVVDLQGRTTVAWIRTGCPLDRRSDCTQRYLAQTRSRSAGGHWGPVQTLGPSVAFDPSLRIVVDAHGDVCVAWAGGAGVRAAYRRPDQRFGRVTRLAPGVSEDGGAIALALSADGRAYLAWSTFIPGEPDRDPPQPMVAASVREPSGAWTFPRQISGRPATQPHIVVAPDGAAIVAWREARPNSEGNGIGTGGVGAAISTPDGGFSVPQHVADADTADVLLATGRPGTTVLAWGSGAYEPEPLHYAVRTDGASAFGAPVAVARAPLQAGQAVLVTLHDGTTVLVVTSSGPRGGVRIARRAAGGTFGPSRMFARRGFGAVVAPMPTGAAVVWRERDELRTAPVR